MRIISGSARGIPLKAPRGRDTRPTTDRVRESLFAILGDFSGAQVLDLFAGTGALGLEALSRGAQQAVFLEKDRAAVKAINENITKAGFTQQAQVIATDTLRFLGNPQRFLHEGDTQFDLLFLDPPYASGLYEPVASALKKSGLLARQGILVVEVSHRDPVFLETEGFDLRRSERYGDTEVHFYRF